MNGKRKLYIALFVLYNMLMVLLLFFRELPEEQLPYWQQMELQLNLVPFRTIGLYWRLLSHSREHLVRLAVINLAGNVIMFIPLGFLLPAAFPRLLGFWKTATVALTAILCVELVQLLTLRGTCDVDDVILNLMGILAGWLLLRLIFKTKKE